MEVTLSHNLFTFLSLGWWILSKLFSALSDLFVPYSVVPAPSSRRGEGTEGDSAGYNWPGEEGDSWAKGM